MQEIYVSVDVETDGPCPGLNSMLSIGCTAFSADGKKYGTFEANLYKFGYARPDPITMEWWDTQPEAWAAHRTKLEDPKMAMWRYKDWLEELPGKPVFVAYPAGFDFTFVYWYLHWATGGCPFSFQALDIKSYAMALMKTPFKETTKSRMPRRWLPEAPHTHIALDDAIEQGQLFLAMLQENLQTQNND